MMKPMKKLSAESFLNLSEGRDFKDSEERKGSRNRRIVPASAGNESRDEIAEKFQCLNLQKHQSSKRGEGNKYGSRREEMKSKTVELEKRLKAPWTPEDLIEEQLNRFCRHYLLSMGPIRPGDVTKLLMSDSVPPVQLASVGWFGDWRPSALLDLLLVLSHSSASFSCPQRLERIVSELARETRTEEAVIDEEMAEIQSTCVVNLPFALMQNRISGELMSSIRFEFRKIRQVFTKAQQLRFKTLEEMVKRVLSPSDAVQFLVSLERIQDVLHRFAAKHESSKGEVTFSIKALDQTESS